MQRYLQKTRLGALLDGIGGVALLFCGSVLFFCLLWGARVMALIAGAAVFIMLITLREKTRARRLRRREAALRADIGGALKLEQWRTAPPARAHFETAALLSGAHPLTLLRTSPEGVLCALGNEKLLVACAQIHPGEKLTARDIAALQRACRRMGAERAALCGAGGETREAAEQAAIAPRVTFVPEGRMRALAGAACPATDAQLVALGKRRRARQAPRSGLFALLDGRRARQYLLYGLLLCLLGAFTRSPFCSAFGCVCLLLMAVCRARGRRENDAL